MVSATTGVDKSACGAVSGYTAGMLPVRPPAPSAASTMAPLLCAIAVTSLALSSCRHEVEPGHDAGTSGEGEGEGECPTDPVLGMTVLVINNVTQFRICEANVEIQSGSYTETLTLQGSTEADCRYVGAEDRPGTYQVRATATGFVPFDVSGIDVEENACGKPIPETVNVRLTPE